MQRAIVTHFLTLEIELQAAAELHRSIVAELEQRGQPLRWAIVAIDVDRHKAFVEAVVTTPTVFPIPSTAVRTI